MRWPLRNQITAPVLAVAVVGLAAVGAINAWLASSRTQERIERQLRGVVGVLTASNFPLTAPVLQKMRDLSSAEFVLADAAGDALATSLAELPPPLPSDAAVRRLDDVTLGDSHTVAGQEYFHTAVPLPPRAGDSDGRVLHVLFPKDEYLRIWREAFLPPLVVGVLTVAAVAAVARLLAGRISRATTRLGDEVLRLARGEFGPVDLPATDDELRDLAVAVNRTAQMLADYEQQVRRTEQMRTVARLGASLAHEMRNATTGCRMAVDLHAEECPAADDESLAVARRQLRLIESQLQRFLQVGRQPTVVVRGEVDLARIVDDLLPLVRPAVRHAKVELDWRPADDELLVMGDEDALSQVALNLILNAIEAVQHEPGNLAATRCVTVELRRGLSPFVTSANEHGAEQKGTVPLSEGPAEEIELIVSDTGPGPAPESAASIFDPFVTSKAEGAGLGLAVAKQIVEAHGGTIAWSRTAGLTQFRVNLPAVAKGAAVHV